MKTLSREIHNKILNELISEVKELCSETLNEAGYSIEPYLKEDYVDIEFRYHYGYVEKIKDFTKKVEVVYLLERKYTYDGMRIQD